LKITFGKRTECERKNTLKMLEIRPCDLTTAKDFVGEHHRHNKPPAGHKFSIACYDVNGDVERLCGVAMVGRPIGRFLDDGLTLEVNRCCTDGTRNACTMLYGAATRAAKALGYKRIFTYTLESEPGTSLKASNWICDGVAGGTHWTGQRYTQLEMQLSEMKVRWHKDL
jgi:hypothetical protein